MHTKKVPPGTTPLYRGGEFRGVLPRVRGCWVVSEVFARAAPDRGYGPRRGAKAWNLFRAWRRAPDQWIRPVGCGRWGGGAGNVVHAKGGERANFFAEFGGKFREKMVALVGRLAAPASTARHPGGPASRTPWISLGDAERVHSGGKLAGSSTGQLVNWSIRQLGLWPTLGEESGSQGSEGAQGRSGDGQIGSQDGGQRAGGSWQRAQNATRHAQSVGPPEFGAPDRLGTS